MDRQEAIEYIRRIRPINDLKEALEVLIPELQESDDERIRKALLYYHKNAPEQYACGCLTNAEVVAWLEKQKEPLFYVPSNTDEQSPKSKISLALGYYKARTGMPDDEYLSLLKYIGELEQKPVELDEETRLGLDRALQIVASAKGKLYGYQSDDGIYECNHAIRTIKHILDSGIEQRGKTNPLFEDCVAKADPETMEEVSENVDKMLNTPKIKGWVARDKTDGLINLYVVRPYRGAECWVAQVISPLPKESYPDLKWEDGPIEVELTIRKK